MVVVHLKEAEAISVREALAVQVALVAAQVDMAQEDLHAPLIQIIIRQVPADTPRGATAVSRRLDPRGRAPALAVTVVESAASRKCP